MRRNFFEKLKYLLFLESLRFRSPKNIALDKILVGQQGGIPSQKWFRQSGDKTRFSTLLENSPYVLFLREADARPYIIEDNAALQKTPYYKMAELHRALEGHFFGATTPREICQWLRRYYQFFRTFDAHLETEPMGRGHSRRGTYPVVNKIIDSDFYEVEDGHHRLAIMVVKGFREAQVIVGGKKRTFLQEELFRVNQTKGTELYQPIALPEVRTWNLIRKCEDRFAMILQFLKEQQLRTKDLSVLDCACSYGWFVSQFKDKGYHVLGVDRDRTVIKLAQLIYDLKETDLRNVCLEEFISTNKKKFDIVLCLSILHHYAIGKEHGSPERIVGALSKITGKVLFVDTGQSHERWFRRTLSRWTTDFIRQFLLNNGDFREVIPIGKDSDNAGKFKDNYGRTLFACLKE